MGDAEKVVVQSGNLTGGGNQPGILSCRVSNRGKPHPSCSLRFLVCPSGLQTSCLLREISLMQGT